MLRTGVSLLALLACLAAHPFAQQAAPAAKAEGRSAKADSQSAKPAMVVNVNSASAAELEQLRVPRGGCDYPRCMVDDRCARMWEGKCSGPKEVQS